MLLIHIMLKVTWDIVVENEHGHIAWEFYYFRYKELLHLQFCNLKISVFNVITVPRVLNRERDG